MNFCYSRSRISRNLNHISLIKGYPTYFVMKFNLQELKADKSVRFPLVFELYSTRYGAVKKLNKKEMGIG